MPDADPAAELLVDVAIVESDGEWVYDEGCLSVPGFYESVTRSEWVRVQALNLDGERFEMELDGLLAVVVQHEMDHLEGKLFIDYLSPLKRRMVTKKLQKQRKQATTL